MEKCSALLAALTVGALLVGSGCDSDEQSNRSPAENDAQTQVDCAIVIPGDDAPTGAPEVAAGRADFMDRRCGDYLSGWCSQFEEAEATRRGCPTRTSPNGNYSEALRDCEEFPAGPHDEGGDRLMKRLADCVRESLG